VQRLYLRVLHEEDARPLPGTEGAQVLAVSPDGQWAAFWADGATRKVRLTGGPAVVVAGDMPFPPKGMSWGRGGQLFLGRSDGCIWRASADGTLEPVTERLEGERSHGLPFSLPRGDVLLFTVRKRNTTWGDEETVAQILASGERKILLRDAVDARFVASGHLVFLRRGVLFAVAFDPERLEVRGEPVALLDHVSQALVSGSWANITGAGQFRVSANGTLAYLGSGTVSYPDARLVSVDRQGRVSALPAPPRPYTAVVRLSPDGQRLAVAVRTLTERGLWVFDSRRGTLTRLTPGGEVFYPVWSPDGEHVAFTRVTDGVTQIARQRADGGAPAEVLLPGGGVPSSWSRDGQQLAVVKDDDIWIVAFDGPEPSLQPLASTEHAEAWPAFSPDGRWLAYAADDSGRFEVYVQPFPGPGPRTQVSISGGESPTWNPVGHEIFFVTAPEREQTLRMMVVDVRTHPALQLGAPRELFTFRREGLLLACGLAPCYNVSADGQRFFGTQVEVVSSPPPVTHIHLVQNWLEEVKARVPTD
jgi:serine/threonine-protein kinase